jgi:hypothetical protein
MRYKRESRRKGDKKENEMCEGITRAGRLLRIGCFEGKKASPNASSHNRILVSCH